MFFFESMFAVALSGIVSSGVMGPVHATAAAVLLATALFAVYEAYARGGDTRGLAVAGMKYLAMGLALTFYGETFNAVNAGFNQIAHSISPNDVWDEFRAQAQSYWATTTSTLWNIVTGAIPGAISLSFQFVSVLIFPVSCALFSFFYTIYGSVLYVVGPLVLALYPAMGVGPLARTYLVNLSIWFGWGIIYAVFCRVMVAINADTMAEIFASASFGSWFQGASQAVLLAAGSILYSIMLLLIPLLSRRIVTGEVGSTMLTVAGTALGAASLAGSAALGLSGGTARASSEGAGASGAPFPSGGGGGGMAGASAGTAPPRPRGLEGSAAPGSPREWGNSQGWANLPAEAAGGALRSFEQAPADLRAQPMWRVGSPDEVTAMAASGDWSPAYTHLAEARATGHTRPASTPHARGGSFAGTYPGDSRVGRNWAHAAGWAAGTVLGAGYHGIHGSLVRRAEKEEREA